MASNNPSNNVKHKLFGYNVAFSRAKNKWQVKDGNRLVYSGDFKECNQYCKENRK